MVRILLMGLLVTVATVIGGEAVAQQEKRPAPELAELLKLTPPAFIRRFDKNNDGLLSKDELPPFLAEFVVRLDTNGDGQLNVAEVAEMLRLLRQRFGPPPQPSEAEIERIVNNILERMDANKDGLISKEEARGAVAPFFDQRDTNKDGLLDKKELRELAIRFRPQGPGGFGPPPGPDFDALDKNADGRLTRDELKGTLPLAVFDEIDTNKDGKIDRKEWAAYVRKQAEKK
jgi:Ca2+-binding EF-hand superfamily protein